MRWHEQHSAENITRFTKTLPELKKLPRLNIFALKLANLLEIIYLCTLLPAV